MIKKYHQRSHEDGIDIDAAFDLLLFAVPEYQDQDCYEEKKFEHEKTILNRLAEKCKVRGVRVAECSATLILLLNNFIQRVLDDSFRAHIDEFGDEFAHNHFLNHNFNRYPLGIRKVGYSGEFRLGMTFMAFSREALGMFIFSRPSFQLSEHLGAAG